MRWLLGNAQNLKLYFGFLIKAPSDLKNFSTNDHEILYSMYGSGQI